MDVTGNYVSEDNASTSSSKRLKRKRTAISSNTEQNSKETREKMLRRKLRPLENLFVGHYGDRISSISSDCSINNNPSIPVLPIQPPPSPPPPTTTQIMGREEVETKEYPLLRCDYSIDFPSAKATTSPRQDSSLHSEADNYTSTTTTTDLLDDEIAYAAIFLGYGNKKANDQNLPHYN